LGVRAAQKMERDLQIHTESVDRLRAELAYVAGYFIGLGYTDCNVLFGFAWRCARDDPELSWKSVRLLLIELDAEIRKAEDAGLGSFAHDDVWVSFEDLELKVQFCHHSGIHLSFSEPNDIAEHFFSRWQAAGLAPIEWEKTEDPMTWCRIRGEVA
jgi:hypothetical protein